MTLFTGSDNSLLSKRYEFSRIFKALVPFWKNWFNSSDINWSSDITVSPSSTRVILYVIFRFSEKKRLNSFPEFFQSFYCHIFLTNQDYWNTSCVLFYTTCCNSFSVSCTFLMIQVSFFKTKSFVNLTFS